MVRALEGDLRGGRLSPGERLPTHRELSQELGISRGTVAKAYEEAQRLGLVRSGIGQGTYVADAFGVRARQEADAQSVDFGMGFPIYELDPDPGPALIALARSPARHDLLRYPPPEGMEHQRAAGARWCSELGVHCDPEEVFLAIGGQNAAYLWLQSAFQPGDALLAGELTYRMVISAAETLGLRVFGVPMDDEGILPDALEKIAQQTQARGLYIMPTLQNPTAGVLPLERRRALLEVVETHGLQVLEDDINGPFFAPPRPTPLRELSPDVVTYATSLSKSLAGGLRVAYVVPPANLRPAYRSALLASIHAAPPLPAEVAARWIEDGTAFATIEAKRREADARTALAQKRLGPWVRSIRSGAYFSWVEMPEPWSAMRLAMEARRRDVSIMPAEAFYIGPGAPPEALRLSLGAVTREQIDRGLGILQELLQHPESSRGYVV